MKVRLILCKCFITYPNSFSVLIYFVFSSWIINEFEITVSTSSIILWGSYLVINLQLCKCWTTSKQKNCNSISDFIEKRYCFTSPLNNDIRRLNTLGCALGLIYRVNTSVTVYNLYIMRFGFSAHPSLSRITPWAAIFLNHYSKNNNNIDSNNNDNNNNDDMQRRR